MELILDCLLDSALDSLKLLPFLFVVYFLIDILEYYAGLKLVRIVQRAGMFGPALGALLGSIPQCGFSVMAAALYNQRFITIGTVMAVFLATSDEFIPIVLSQPEHISLLLPIVVIKIAIALVCGYALDIVLHKRNKERLLTMEEIMTTELEYARCGCGCEGYTQEDEQSGNTIFLEDAEISEEDYARYGIEPGEEVEEAPRWMVNLYYFGWVPLKHALKVLAIIFVITLVLALLFAFVGTDRIAAFMNAVPALQPFVAALIGLIPNCAASVAVTELYLEGVLNFGAAIAGLSAAGGLGIIVLFQEGEKRDALLVTGLLFVLSVVAGIVCTLFM